MPPLKVKSPQSLEKLCFLEVVSHLKRELYVCNQVRKFENKSLLLRRRGLKADELQLEVSYYLDKLPPLLSEIVRQDITNMLMSKTKEFITTKGLDLYDDVYDSPPVYLSSKCNYQKQALIQMLEVVLNNEVKSFEFYAGGPLASFKASSKIWPLILKCTGLERLVFMTDMFVGEPIDVRNFISPFLKELTVNCSSLTELVLKDAVTNSEPLQVIGVHCKHLQKLDVTGSRINCNDVLRLCIEIQPLPALVLGSDNHTKLSVPTGTDKFDPSTSKLTALCQTLKELILTGTNVRAKGAGRLLQLVTNLTSLGDLVYTAAGLQNIYSLIKAKKSRTLKLKHVFYRGPSNIKLKILANCCPSLESLYLGSKTERRIHAQLHVNSLSFKRLHSLTLENIHNDDIPLALKHAPNLIKLDIDCSGLDISAISRFSPKLRELKIHKEPARDMHHLNNPPGLPTSQPFKQLEVLRILSPVSGAIASIFFENAERLRLVELVRVRDVGDFEMRTWLDSNSLKHLEELMIRYIGCTRITVDRLLCTCPRLTKLGEMGGWDIRSWECRRIKDTVTAKNYDLELVMHTAASSDIYDIFHDNMSSSNDDDSDSNQSNDNGAVQGADLIWWNWGAH